jgi:chemotaxis protein MotA
MVVLLSNLSGADAAKTIGPAMGICLITTLYGVALANLLIIPIAENLLSSARELKIKNFIIVEGVRLIMEETNPVILAEELNSFLLPGDRIDWKSAVKNG